MCGGACYCSQAEDGIRDLIVTGVQTCALPIWLYRLIQSMRQKSSGFDALQHPNSKLRTTLSNHRGRLCSALGAMGVRVCCGEDSCDCPSSRLRAPKCQNAASSFGKKAQYCTAMCLFRA